MKAGWKECVKLNIAIPRYAKTQDSAKNAKVLNTCCTVTCVCGEDYNLWDLLDLSNYTLYN